MAAAVAARLASGVGRPEPRAASPTTRHNAAPAPPCRRAQAAVAVVGRREDETRLPAFALGEGHPPRLARRGAVAKQAPEAQDQAVPERGEEGVAALRADLRRYEGLV